MQLAGANLWAPWKVLGCIDCGKHLRTNTSCMFVQMYIYTHTYKQKNIHNLYIYICTSVGITFVYLYMYARCRYSVQKMVKWSNPSISIDAIRSVIIERQLSWDKGHTTLLTLPCKVRLPWGWAETKTTIINQQNWLCNIDSTRWYERVQCMWHSFSSLLTVGKSDGSFSIKSKPTRTVHGKGDNSQTWPDATCSS